MSVSDPVKYLSQRSIQLSQEVRVSELRVPPATPKDLIQDFEAATVPSSLPSLSSVNLPLVREIGVKETIIKLAEIYDCRKFNCNLVQFWFLDFMTDSLWKVQDEFQFSEGHQKVVLEWIAYFFNLLRAPSLNLTKKGLFKIFNEALNIAEQQIESGCEFLPLPDELFTIKTDIHEKLHEENMESSSASSLNEANMEINRNKSYLAIDLKEGMKFYDLPDKVCPWDTEDDRLSSTVETVSENEILPVKSESSSKKIEINELKGNDSEIFEDFYKPDLSMPTRFARFSSDSLFSDSSSISYENETSESDGESGQLAQDLPTWVVVKTKTTPDAPCPSTVFNVKHEDKEKNKKIKEQKVVQAWYNYQLWQFKKKAMDDPLLGWVLSQEEIDVKVKGKDNKDVQTEPDVEAAVCKDILMDYMNNVPDDMKTYRENRFVNTCVIMAIRQIIYDYFYDSFQFSLLKAAYRYPQFLITQDLNEEWYTPKKMKEEIKRPKPKKKKEKSKMKLKSAIQISKDCQTRGKAGTCQRVSNCPYAIRLVQQNDRPDICEFERLEPIVCCPDQPKPSKPIKTNNDVPNADEIPLSVKMCLKYYPTPDFFIEVAGGEKSLPQQFPHMAAVGFGEENDKQWLCGGSLVSKKFVLTAAHCLYSIVHGDAKWIRLGDLDLSTDEDDASPQDFTIIKRIYHPDYKYPEKYHDIALLELDKIVTFNLYVSPACLQTTKKINETSMTATGWGKTSFVGDSSSFLMKVNLNEVDEKTCYNSFNTSRVLPRGIIAQTQICAGGIVGKDTCSGDSGGPLQVKNRVTTFSEVHTIIGVTSFGKACGLSSSPGVYTRVSYYRRWLEKIIWANEND